MKNFVLFFFFVYVNGQQYYEGDTCVYEGRAGTCTNMRRCPSAIQDIKNNKRPLICTFSGTDPVVCCVTQQNVLTTSKRPPTQSTTPYVPPFYDYEDLTGQKFGECEPIAPSLTSPKTGRKAWDKCIEYQENYVYPCQNSPALTGGKARTNHCKHNADELIVGGVDAGQYEFPHMALLGYDNGAGGIAWQCGGALISDKFVITAGHCIADRIGPVTHVQVGIHRKSDNPPANKLYTVRRIIPHPEYKAPNKYNDIALLELDRTVKLDQFTVPACLHTGDNVNDARASATGWGLTEYRGNKADILQKVILTKFSTQECSAKYPAFRHMKQGLNAQTQMCYGDKTMSKDTCQGDSGGPLQIKNKQINCMYTLVGVTSFGRACGFVGEPGIYTRVAPYTAWIESVVWP